MSKGHQNCRGVKVPRYKGPVLQAVVAYREFVPGAGASCGAHRERRTTLSAPLSNPRKSDTSVLSEICARFKQQHPTATLVSFWREEV